MNDNEIDELRSRISALEVLLGQSIVMGCRATSNDPISMIRHMRSSFEEMQNSAETPIGAPGQDTANRIFDTLERSMRHSMEEDRER